MANFGYPSFNIKKFLSVSAQVMMENYAMQVESIEMSVIRSKRSDYFQENYYVLSASYIE